MFLTNHDHPCCGCCTNILAPLNHMTAFIVLIICSLIVATAFLIGFLYSVKKGQFDDIYTPSVRMLFDEELKKEKSEDSKLKTLNSKL